MVVAPSAITASSTRHRKSISLRYPSSGENSTSPHRLRANRTASLACSNTWSGDMRSFFSMCSGEVAMKVWMRARLAPFRASAARLMSRSLARDSEHTVESLIAAAIAFTASKSPLELAAKPASMTSTFSLSSWRAMRSFSSLVIDAPGDCSPSRKVVSKMISWSAIASSASFRRRQRLPGALCIAARALQAGNDGLERRRDDVRIHADAEQGASPDAQSRGRRPPWRPRPRRWRARGNPAPAPDSPVACASAFHEGVDRPVAGPCTSAPVHRPPRRPTA
jgi:hypothetical protein